MTTGKGTSVGSWFRRYGLSLAVFLSMPLIFLVMSSVSGALTPDSRCFYCQSTGEDISIPAELEGPERAAYKVQKWIELEEGRLPTWASQPMQFEWERDTPGAEGEEQPRGTAQVAADDLRARYGYGIPTVLLILICIPVTLAALLAMPAGWRYMALAAIGIAVILGLLFQDAQPVRIFTAEYMLGVAALSPYPFLTPTTWETTFRIVSAATVAGMTVTAAIIVLFSWLASGPTPGSPPLTKSELRRRTRLFKMAMALGSLVLILAVASAHGLFQWSPVLMAPEARGVMESLGSSAALYWGVIHSLTLVAVSVPAALRIRAEIGRTAVTPADESPTSATELAHEIGFDFELRQTVSTAMTLAAPLLTGPLLDMVRHVTGGS